MLAFLGQKQLKIRVRDERGMMGDNHLIQFKSKGQCRAFKIQLLNTLHNAHFKEAQRYNTKTEIVRVDTGRLKFSLKNRTLKQMQHDFYFLTY